MANGGVVTSGLSEMRAAVDAFTRVQTAALRAVAAQTAQRVQAGARQRLLAQTRGSGATAAAITLSEEPEKRQFLVRTVAPAGKAENLVLWLEFGTVKMAARPFLSPAAAAESARYRHDMEAAAVAAAIEVFK